MSDYKFDPKDWTYCEYTKPEDGSSGGCSECAHVDGEDDDGSYMLKFWTDGGSPEGAGDVICPECFVSNTIRDADAGRLPGQRDLLIQAVEALIGVFGDEDIAEHDGPEGIGHELEGCALCLGRAALAAVRAEGKEATS